MIMMMVCTETLAVETFSFKELRNDELHHGQNGKSTKDLH